MSYDLRVWEPPAGQAIAGSFEQALRNWFELELLEPGPNPKFSALAARMAAYRECGDAPWVGDPVADAARCRKAVWTFQLPADNRMQLLSAVVKHANALGLTVLDDQLGLALVAPDRVLPPERAGFWKEAMQVLERVPGDAAPPPPAPAPPPARAPLSMALASARDEMRSVLASLLPQHGFISPRLALELPYYHAQVETTYFRSTPAGGQGVVLLTSATNHLPCLTIDVNVFSEEIANILRAVFPEHDEMYFRRQLNFYVGIFQDTYAYFPIKNSADLQRMVKEVQDPVGPILEMTRTPLGMHAIMAGTTVFPLPGHPQGHKTLAEHAQKNFGYAALVSFWLYGGDQFQAMAQQKRASEERLAPPAMKEEMVQRVDRLLAYLRAQVKRKA
jgi:glyoxylase-like metal-dependent hydrolase (beta-lactamase superfamily II)